MLRAEGAMLHWEGIGLGLVLSYTQQPGSPNFIDAGQQTGFRQPDRGAHLAFNSYGHAAALPGSLISVAGMTGNQLVLRNRRGVSED